MSANNYILIDRKTLKVSMRDMDTDYKLQEIGQGRDINEAIDLAQKAIKEEFTEYGIYFK